MGIMKQYWLLTNISYFGHFLYYILAHKNSKTSDSILRVNREQSK